MGGGKCDNSEAIRDAHEFGLPEEQIAQLEAHSDDGDFEVWPENWDTVQAFLAVSTQWRMVALMDGRTYWQGLDYAGVQAGLAGAGIDTTPDLWRGLRVMEGAARNRLNGGADND